MGIAGLVVGIVGLILSIVGAANPLSNTLTIIGLVLAVIGIVLSAISMKKDAKHGKAVAGLVLCIIAVVISVIMLIACGGTKQAINDIANTVTQDVNNMNEEELQSVADDLANQLSDALNVTEADAQN